MVEPQINFNVKLFSKFLGLHIEIIYIIYSSNYIYSSIYVRITLKNKIVDIEHMISFNLLNKQFIETVSWETYSYLQMLSVLNWENSGNSLLHISNGQR